MSALIGAVLAAALTFVLSVTLPLVVKPLLVRLGIMDVPSARSSHDRPVLRGLGLAVLIAMFVGGGVAVLLGERTDGAGIAGAGVLLAVIVGGFTLAGLLGFSEDLRGLSVKVRSVTLLAIGVAGALGLLLTVPNSVTPGSPVTPLMLPVWGAVVFVIYAVLFVSSFINVANFMDGLNGISGFHGVIAGLTFAATGWLGGLPWLVAAGLCIAAGFAGFLPWNLTRPGAFLGDVGSYLLGGSIALTSLAAFLAGIPLLSTIGPLVIYFGDVAVTLVTRVRAGKRWDEPHKEHTYQRIQQAGYSHVQASLMVAACTLLTSLLGIAAMFTGVWGTIGLLAAGVAVLAIYLALPRLLRQRPSVGAAR